jgi:hypothetical protein
VFGKVGLLANLLKKSSYYCIGLLLIIGKEELVDGLLFLLAGISKKLGVSVSQPDYFIGFIFYTGLIENGSSIGLVGFYEN